jgi:hypothetical protein
MADNVQDAKDLIAQMKKAVKVLADESAGTKDSAVIAALELDLEGIMTTEGGPDFKFKIFGKELGLGGKYSKENLQTITISLVPEEEIRPFGREEISVTLVNALRMIRDTVAFAAAEPPRYELGEAAVELSFEVTKEGSFNFFVEGTRESVATQTVRIKLKASSSANDAS